MEKINRAIRIMNIVRIVAAALVVASAILYFSAREYAIYPAIAGFAIIAFINLPLNVWMATQRGKIKKDQAVKSDQEDKDERKHHL